MTSLTAVCSVAQSCPPLCDSMGCSMPGLPVHHQLPEPAQTHVHLVGDAIQPSHPLSSPSPPAFSLSQHQVLTAIGPGLTWSMELLFFDKSREHVYQTDKTENVGISVLD